MMKGNSDSPKREVHITVSEGMDAEHSTINLLWYMGKYLNM